MSIWIRQAQRAVVVVVVVVVDGRMIELSWTSDGLNVSQTCPRQGFTWMLIHIA